MMVGHPAGLDKLLRPLYDEGAYIFAIGPGTDESVGTTWVTLDINLILQESSGWVESSAGELDFPRSGLYLCSVSIDVDKLAAGTEVIEMKMQYHDGTTWRDVLGGQTKGSVLGNAKGGGIERADVPLRIAAGRMFRVQVQSPSAMEVPTNGMLISLRRIAP